jgi:predicted TIM-barrel fold metal-dependent hydrolase
MAAALKPLTEFPIFDPPPRRYQGPIVDAHMHTKDVAAIQAYWDIGDGLYGVHHVVAIVDLATAIELRKTYGSRVQPAVWAISPRQENFKDRAGFRKAKEAHLEQIAAEGFRIIKLWFTPRFHEWSNIRLDDPALDFFFERVQRLRLSILIHVADPDYWFAHQINDLEQHGSKAEQYLQLTTRLEQFPEIVVQAAHLGGDPEHLDHLASLLERYPNLHLDSSATKWIAREFSRHGPAARDFLVRFADRVLFGTDLVANPEREKEGKREHYATRFYVHQLMWEQSGSFESPIEDEDSVEPPRFEGLNLPEDVLAKFYWGNAARLHGFTRAPASK